MAVSETIQYTFLFALTVVFSIFAIFIDEYTWKMMFKVAAGLLWSICSLVQFVAGDSSSVLTIASSLVFAVFAFLYFLSTVLDWFTEMKTDYQPKRKMGVFN